MENSTLQCLLLGRKPQVYIDLARLLSGLDLKLQVKSVNADKASLTRGLKQLSTAGLVFISDHAPFSLELLSELVWQYSPDSIVVILTEKTHTTALSRPFNGACFSKLFFDKDARETKLFIQYLTQMARLKTNLRKNKLLLDTSEKRCQSLLDSNKEAQACISRGLNLYANPVNSQQTLEHHEPNPDSILNEVIKRKEATIAVQNLTSLKNIGTKRGQLNTPFILSLMVPAEERKGVNDLLFRSSDGGSRNKQLIFWNKVKIIRLFQILSKKETPGHKLIIPLNEAAIGDNEFVKWMLSNLKKMGTQSSHLTFMLPSRLDMSQTKACVEFIKQLRARKSGIAMDDFSESSGSLSLLKQLQPDYVRLSLSWLRELEGNDSREIALAGLVRQLEERQVKVIAPCGFSKAMRKLFILSGASFCQERASKST